MKRLWHVRVQLPNRSRHGTIKRHARTSTRIEVRLVFALRYVPKECLKTTPSSNCRKNLRPDQDFCGTRGALPSTLSRWRHGFESRWGCFVIPGENIFSPSENLHRKCHIFEKRAPLMPIQCPKSPGNGLGKPPKTCRYPILAAFEPPPISGGGLNNKS